MEVALLFIEVAQLPHLEMQSQKSLAFIIGLFVMLLPYKVYKILFQSALKMLRVLWFRVDDFIT